MKMRTPKTATLLALMIVLPLAACDQEGMGATDGPAPADLAMTEVPDLSTTPPDLSVRDSAVADSGPSGECPAAAGKVGQELLLALGSCVRGHKVFSYNDARDAMFRLLSDPANMNSVECIYTARKAPMVMDRASANLNMINTEHTWPQSLGATGTAMSDMHHLFPTDVTANSKRGNYPFGVVMTATWTGPDLDGKGPSKLGTQADGTIVFEPRDPVKGNLARALFYFYTRYEQEMPMPTSFSTANFKVEEATLHKWHMQDPPDAAEKAYNEAIFQMQMNRNPYIDHPEYVDQIGNFLMK